MLLDLGRNDVGRVARVGTRRGHRALHDRALLARHAPGLERARPAAPGPRLLRRLPRDVPGRHAQRRAEDPRDGDHRGARAGPARRLRRRGGVLRLLGRHGHRDRDPLGRSCATGAPSSRRAPASSPTRIPEAEHRECVNKARCGGPGGAHGGAALMARVLMIDNYDSFTYNLVQYLAELGRRGRRAAQRRDHARRGGGARAGRHRHLAGAVHAARGGRLGAAHPALRRAASRSSASAWAIRRSAPPSAATSCARRASCTARRRPSTTTGAGVFAGLPDPVRRHALSLAGDRPGDAARRARAHRLDRRGRDHGRAAPRPRSSRACSSIPSRS